MKITRESVSSAVVFAITFLYVLILSLKALWIGDDITYQFSFLTNEGIRSLRDILDSQIEHYFTWNGRFVAHFLVQVILAFCGKVVFALLNASVSVILLILVCKYCGNSLKDWRTLGLASGLLLLGLQTKFVPTCQIGYQWMFCLILGFILLYRKAGASLSAWNLIWLAPFSFLAGWSQEALVVGIAAALAIEVLTHWRTMSACQWVMLCFFALGSMLLCLSPASIHRTGSTNASTDLVPSVVLSFAKFFLYLRTTYLLIAVALIRFARDRSMKAVYRTDPFLWNAWAVLILFNLAVGVFGNRQLFGIELLSIILTIRMALPEKTVTVLSGVLALLMAGIGCHKYFQLEHRNSIYEDVVAQACASSDGTAYYDLASSDVSLGNNDPGDPFSWYVKSTINRQLHAEGRLSGEQRFDILPTCCQHASAEQILHNAKGSIVLVIRRDSMPSYASISRELRFPGINLHLPSFRSGLDNPIFSNEDVMVFQFFEKVPLVHNVEISLH